MASSGGAARQSDRYTVLISVGRDLSDTLYPPSTLLAYQGLQTHI
jgi:hypothetical protein